MKTILKAVIITLITIIGVNAIFWLAVLAHLQPFYELYEDGVVIKVKPYAFVFAHGMYVYTSMDHAEYAHITTLRHENYRTIDFVNKLNNEGYTYIWGTWCGQGDHDYILENDNGVVPWPSFVDRVKTPGEIAPVFVGLGFIRITF